MELRYFENNDLAELKRLIDSVIDDCYSDVYCPEAVTFFKKVHSRENIEQDARQGTTIVLTDGGCLLATGTLLDCEIRRVFVLKEFQGQKLGKRIMDRLENIAAQKGKKQVLLCSSLVSKVFYDHRGYETVRKACLQLEAGGCLDYYDMRKDLITIK